MPKTPKENPQQQPAPEDVVNLEKELARLKAEHDALAAEVQAKQEAEAPRESTPLPADRLASQATEEEIARAQVLRDPYDTRNALKILSDPPGKKLRWVSLSYRETRNMRGWQPVRYDDAIGRELDKYIGVPPERMAGTASLDSVVRRGDVILCWLDYGIWLKRQIDRETKANSRLRGHASPDKTQYGEFGLATGDGLKRDANPYTETRLAPGFVSTEEAYRRQAKGTPNDPAQRVAGRNMFQEASDEE